MGMGGRASVRHFAIMRGTLRTFGCWSERTNPAARPPAAPSPCKGPISHPRRFFSPQPRLWPVELLTDSRICRGRTGPAKPPPVPDPLPQPPHRPAGAAGSQWAAGHPPAQPRRQPRHPQARQTGWSTSPPAFSSLPHKLPLLFLLLTHPDPSFQASERDLQALRLRSPPCGGMQKRDRRGEGQNREHVGRRERDAGRDEPKGVINIWHRAFHFTSRTPFSFASHRTSGLPTPGAATVCPAGATARCKGRARCRSTPLRRPC